MMKKQSEIRTVHFILILVLLQSCSIPSALQTRIEPVSTPYKTSSINSTVTQTLIQIPTVYKSPPTPTPAPPPLVRIPKGDRALFFGDYDLALKEYQVAVNSVADSETQSAGLVGMGLAQYLAGKIQPAIQALLTAIERFPHSTSRANAFFLLARCYIAQNNPQKAAEYYSQYLLLRPGVLDAYVAEKLGDALFAAKDYEGSIKAYVTASNAGKQGDTQDIEIKIGKSYAAQGDHSAAVRKFLAIYQASNNDYTKAAANLLAGQSYLALGYPEQAYARYNDSVTNFPLSYNSFTALVALVNANIPVDEYSRGRINYQVGQYGLAIDAFNRNMQMDPKHDGRPHHFKALSMRALKQNESAINEWLALIKDHPNDKLRDTAYQEIAQTQWQYQNKPEQAVQTLLAYLKSGADINSAPNTIFLIGRIQESSTQLPEAAASWERLINEYPSSNLSLRALFLAGIIYYRASNYPYALKTFQRHMVLSSKPEDLAASHFWIGKCYLAMKDNKSADTAWEQAAVQDPTGYYSERARELILRRAPLQYYRGYDLGYDLGSEKSTAEKWMISTFTLPASTKLDGLGKLKDDPRVWRGNAFWELGLYSEARAEYESLRLEIIKNPEENFRLLSHVLDLGLYREAILISRQILNLAGLENNETLRAPVFFNRIRFGPYYYDLVLEASKSNNIHPLLLFSIMRQESFFEGFAGSSAGARGLMQIMPATGKEVASLINWPANYNDEDLYRPMVNIQLGAKYFARQRDYFQNDLFAALAAYNAGPGNTKFWKDISRDDPDLFLEVIRFSETRQYIMQIFEFNYIYNRIYDRN